MGGKRTAAVVTGLRPGTRYSFAVRARDAADNLSPASGAARLTTAPGADDGHATAPTGFRATARRDDWAYSLAVSPVRRNPSPARGRSACGRGAGHVGSA
ncbi:hypothetical protein STRIP9103_00455 [Streptomyces ipomoeae 91-03]|uniref:Fibronectin type-III domain-containing protein n=1 Tax=Streptomyces ipomoeae 91-03 TaxID=698759 RepID=L1KPZ3_9ACTN|nr:hypothetical protein STRIP9103_00455 [Streptomyces ipomoeae 91-03]